MINAVNIPSELKMLTQWMVWRKEERNGRQSKVPYNARTGGHAKTNDPTTWVSFDAALFAYEQTDYDHPPFDGIGFAFNEGDGLIGIDVDYPRGSDIALEIINKFQGTYCEESPSGKLRIFTKGKISRCGKGDADKLIEIYNHTSPRYLTVTGKWIDNSTRTIESCQNGLDWLFNKYFDSHVTQPTATPQKLNQEQNNALLSDSDILRIVGKAKNAGKFAELFGGAGNKDESAGDLALAKMIAFYTQCPTGGDESQLDQIMRQSARKNIQNGKWDAKHGADGRTYGQMTIAKAIEKTSQTFTPKPAPNKAAVAVAKAQIKPYFSDTDLGNGERFKHLHADKAKYCKAWEKWLIWNGKRWEVDEGAIALILAEETTMHIVKEIDYWRGLVQSETDDAKKEAILSLIKSLEKHARYSSFKGGLQNMLWDAGEKRLPIKPDLLDSGDWLLNVANGTVDLKTGQLMPHNQADLITKLVDIPFDANAKAPRWEKFLDEVMGGDKEMTHYLQKAIGYTLTGDTKEQCFFFLYGLGNNGKSLFTSTLEKLLGGSKEYCTRVPAESLMKKAGQIVMVPHHQRRRWQGRV